jgi:hypothetical protein
MRKSHCITLLLFAAIGAPTAHAQTTYTYTGNDFTTFVGLTCPSDCSIDGSFTVSSPLGPGTTTTKVTPTAFDFYISTADSPTWTNLNGASAGPFSVTTNATGLIISWDIAFYSSGHVYPIFVTSYGDSGNTDQFTYGLNPPMTSYIDGLNTDDPGTWTMTPEPSSLILMLTGGVWLWLVMRKRLGRGLPQSRLT